MLPQGHPNARVYLPRACPTVHVHFPACVAGALQVLHHDVYQADGGAPIQLVVLHVAYPCSDKVRFVVALRIVAHNKLDVLPLDVGYVVSRGEHNKSFGSDDLNDIRARKQEDHVLCSSVEVAVLDLLKILILVNGGERRVA